VDGDGARIGCVGVRGDGEYEHEDHSGNTSTVWRGHTSPSYTVVADALAGDGEKPAQQVAVNASEIGRDGSLCLTARVGSVNHLLTLCFPFEQSTVERAPR
jgi:hypothetical protein